MKKKAIRIKPVPKWTTIYARSGYLGCWHVEWGHEQGPPLTYATIKRLSLKYFKEHKVDMKLECMQYIINQPYALRGGSSFWVTFPQETLSVW